MINWLESIQGSEVYHEDSHSNSNSSSSSSNAQNPSGSPRTDRRIKRDYDDQEYIREL